MGLQIRDPPKWWVFLFPFNQPQKQIPSKKDRPLLFGIIESCADDCSVLAKLLFELAAARRPRGSVLHHFQPFHAPLGKLDLPIKIFLLENRESRLKLGTPKFGKTHFVGCLLFSL